MPIPTAPGDPSGALEIYRCAVPLPTILPSYNQIGFDSLQYLAGMVEGTQAHGIGWVIGGKLTKEGATVPDPETKVLFPVEVAYDQGLITLENEAGFTVNAMNADIPFDSFRASAHLGADGTQVTEPGLHVTTNCSNIPTYGSFLISLGFCNPATHIMNVFGSFNVRRYAGGAVSMPAGLGSVAFSASPGTLVSDGTVQASIANSQLKLTEHSFGSCSSMRTAGARCRCSMGWLPSAPRGRAGRSAR